MKQKKLKNREVKKVALFGGSFNPIHNQHIKMIETIAKSNIIDEVWIIPCKKHAFNKGFAPARHRIKMIKIAVSHLPNVKLSRVELNTKGITYTINTIKTLQSKYNYKFFWIIGSDIPYEIHKWNSYKQIFKKMSFIVFKRKGYPTIKVKGMKIYKVFSKYINNISSTKIRNMAKEEKSLKKFVPLSICKYIIKNKLYK